PRAYASHYSPGRWTRPIESLYSAGIGTMGRAIFYPKRCTTRGPHGQVSQLVRALSEPPAASSDHRALAVSGAARRYSARPVENRSQVACDARVRGAVSPFAWDRRARIRATAR